MNGHASARTGAFASQTAKEVGICRNGRGSPSAHYNVWGGVEFAPVYSSNALARTVRGRDGRFADVRIGRLGANLVAAFVFDCREKRATVDEIRILLQIRQD